MSSRRRGGSIFAGLLLILLGILFLIDIYKPQLRLGHLIAVYWPVLLVIWGVAKLVDYLAAQRSGETRPAILSGGEAVLIVVLVIVLGAFVTRDWVRGHFPNFNLDIPEFGPSYTRSQTLTPQGIPANSQIAINLGRGDISVRGGTGNELRVNAHKRAWGMSEAAAERAMQASEVTIEGSGGRYWIRPAGGWGHGRRTSIDLAVDAPSSASIAASTAHGDIAISNIDGSMQARTGYGDVQVKNAGGDVAVHVNRGDAQIAGVAGSVRIAGRGGDVDISDVKGGASIEGAFDSSISAKNVAKTVHCVLPWSAITIGRLDGSLETDLGDLSISGASGPVKIVTHNTDIDVKNVTARLDIADAHGDIKVVFSSPPQEDINITNDAGDINVTLPSGSNFQVAAISRSGDVQSDFSDDQLNVWNSDGSGQMTGRVGASGGPRITIATTYGTIRLRKGD